MAADVDMNGAVEHFQRYVDGIGIATDVLGRQVRGVGVQDVQPSELSHGAADQSLDLTFFAYIGLAGEGASTRGLDSVRHFLRGVPVEIAHGDGTTLFGQAQATGRTYAAGAAHDGRDLS
jgi:hypothetical protein